MMFKDKYVHKFYAFALAAVFALTLAGCGGGGGGTAQMPDTEPPAMPEPTAEETCEGDGGRYNADGSCTSAEDLAAEMAEAEALSGAQEAAMAAYMAAMAAVNSAKDPIAMVNAQAIASSAKTASDMAAAATTSEVAMEYQAKAEMYRDMTMAAAEMRGLAITKLANAVANKSAIDSASLVGTTAPAPISNAGRAGRAIAGVGRAAAAPTFGADTATDSITDQGTNQGGGAVTVTAKHTGSAPRFTVTATPEGGSASTLSRGETPAALMSSGEKPSGGWPGAELTRTVSGDTGSKEHALVFTDINPPKQVYSSDPDAANHFSATELAATTTVVNTAVITGKAPGDGSHFVGTLNVDPTDNNPPVTGRFHCAATPCSISVDSAGVLVAVQGYEFRPAVAGDLTAQDSDYLSWGVWLFVPNALQETSSTGLTNPAQVGSFANGSDLFQVNAALTGSATYKGDASGLYAAGGMVEYFDADVSLTADFGGRSGNDSNPRDDTADANLFGAVTGSVTNIKAGGMDVEGSITLGRAPVLSTDGSAAATSFDGRAAGVLGSKSLSGSWGGRFYGPNRAPDGSVAVRTEFPTTAAGTFSAATTSGISGGVSIIGAFGAWKAE